MPRGMRGQAHFTQNCMSSRVRHSCTKNTQKSMILKRERGIRRTHNQQTHTENENVNGVGRPNTLSRGVDCFSAHPALRGLELKMQW